jgi:hypothetical protein
MSSSDDDAHTDTTGSAPHRGGHRAPVRSLQDSLQVLIDQGEGRTVVTVTGEIDYDSAPLLQRALDQALRSCGSRLEVDLAGVGSATAQDSTSCCAHGSAPGTRRSRSPWPGSVARSSGCWSSPIPLFTLTAPAPRAAPAQVRWLAYPLPVRVTRTAGPGPLPGAWFMDLGSVDRDGPGEAQGLSEQC